MLMNRTERAEFWETERKKLKSDKWKAQGLRSDMETTGEFEVQVLTRLDDQTNSPRRASIKHDEDKRKKMLEINGVL
jgi:hypothetical protein